MFICISLNILKYQVDESDGSGPQEDKNATQRHPETKEVDAVPESAGTRHSRRRTGSTDEVLESNVEAHGHRRPSPLDVHEISKSMHYPCVGLLQLASIEGLIYCDIPIL